MGESIIVDGAERGVVFSEDCLNLNIWTKPQVGEAKKAVMLWIYGGACIEGYTGDPRYDGQYIADQKGVAVVSIKYIKADTCFRRQS